MHHKEIGGYLELEHFGGREYYPDAVALNCARNAFAYLIEARHIHEVWIPWFVCASVEQAAGRYDLDVHRYAVDNRLRTGYCPTTRSARRRRGRTTGSSSTR